jgi:hypothetical protein
VVRVSGYTFRISGFDSRRYQIFCEVVGLEWGPLSLVRITVELLEWKSNGSGQENRINGRGIRCADHATPSICKRTSPTSGGRSVGIVRLRTIKATELLRAAVHLSEGEGLEGQQNTGQFTSVQFFVYFHTELVNQWPVTESPRMQNINSNKTT